MDIRFFRKSRLRALVLGLDGVPFSLIREYIARGILPNTEKILAQGFRLEQMDASVPDVSSTSWTSFMAGVNPGEHGIYGFMELQPGTYKRHFQNFNDVQAPTIWEMLGRTTNGKRSSLQIGSFFYYCPATRTPYPY